MSWLVLTKEEDEANVYNMNTFTYNRLV